LNAPASGFGAAPAIQGSMRWSSAGWLLGALGCGAGWDLGCGASALGAAGVGLGAGGSIVGAGDGAGWAASRWDFGGSDSAFGAMGGGAGFGVSGLAAGFASLSGRIGIVGSSMRRMVRLQTVLKPPLSSAI
jgi:hypothetical protein